jgi:TOTE conflict system, Archaeo-Eukaryotic Primase domain
MDPSTYVGLWAYADLFSAHTEAYVRDSRRHVNDQITPELVVAAFTEKWSISGYTARLDGERMVTHIGAIDFDKALHDEIEAVRGTLFQINVPTLLAESRRGAHLWVVTQTEGPADQMRRALEHAIRLTDSNILAKSEVFPKHSNSKFGGGALRMPLMTHPKNGQRYPVFDMQANRLTKIKAVVEAAQFTEWSVLRRFSAEEPIEYPTGLGQYRRVIDRGDTGSAVEMLNVLGVQAVIGKGCRCPFHDDQHNSLSVAQDDQRVWCKAPECVAYNGGRGVGTLALARMVRERNGK